VLTSNGLNVISKNVVQDTSDYNPEEKEGENPKNQTANTATNRDTQNEVSLVLGRLSDLSWSHVGNRNEVCGNNKCLAVYGCKDWNGKVE